jgi:hypothetical protein
VHRSDRLPDLRVETQTILEQKRMDATMGLPSLNCEAAPFSLSETNRFKRSSAPRTAPDIRTGSRFELTPLNQWH